MVCAVAGCCEPLRQLAQLHCPVPRANRRMLHVLACPRPECTAKPEGWVAIRSQAADAATNWLAASSAA